MYSVQGGAVCTRGVMRSPSSPDVSADLVQHQIGFIVSLAVEGELSRSVDQPPAVFLRMSSHRSRRCSSIVSSMRLAKIQTCPDGSMTRAVRSPQN
jgi:hypothetical protein